MNLTKENKELKTFGLSFGLGLMVVATILKIKGHRYVYLPPLSILIVLIALIRPEFLKPLKGVLEKIFRIITALITTVLLLFLFYLVITSLGIIARLFGKKFLKLGFENIPSYFEKRERGKVDREIYERQF